MRRPRFAPAALLLLTACGNPAGPDGPPPLLSALPRELSLAERGIVAGANAFAFDLLRTIAEGLPPDSNAVLSPLSASFALGLALNGAGGETYSAMRAALRLDGLSEAEINDGYRDLIDLLRELDRRIEMQVANSIWGHQGLAIEPAFTDAGREFFDAEVRTADFSAPATLEAINEWVADRTNGRIPRLLDATASDEVLFVINALYFKGEWREAFDRKDSHDGRFHAADGTARSTPLMVQEATLRYTESGTYQAVDLLYGNGAFAMTVVLPSQGTAPGDLLARMDAAGWETLVTGFHEATVRLTLPRFRIDYSRRLREDLEALGMGIAFDPSRADLWRIADVRPERLYISRVDQKTFVDVNEEGTEATAATSVGVGVTSAPEVHEMTADRPFVFAIRERFSGTLLFLGIMNSVGS